MTAVRRFHDQLRADQEAAELAELEAAAAARLAKGQAVLDAAELLGSKVSEIRDVDPDDPRGVRIDMVAAGSSYLLVPADKPDAAGRSGLMIAPQPRRVVPNESGGYALAPARERIGNMFVYKEREG